MEITDITEELKPTQVLLKNTSAEFCFFCLFNIWGSQLTNSQLTNHHCRVTLKAHGTPIILGLYLVLKLQLKHRENKFH